MRCATSSGCTSSTRRSTSGRTPRTSGGRGTTSTRLGTRATRRTSPRGTRLDLDAMIDAHRNHPSIIAWSIGNEIDYPNDPYAHPLFKEAVGNNDAGKPRAERLYDPDRPDIRRLTTIAKRLAAHRPGEGPDPARDAGGRAAGAVEPDRASRRTSISSATTTRSTCTTPITVGSPTSRSSAARTRTATPTGCRSRATTTSPVSSCGRASTTWVRRAAGRSTARVRDC